MFCSRFEEIEALGTVVLSKTPDAHDVVMRFILCIFFQI